MSVVSLNQRVFIGLATTVILFILFRVLDEFVVPRAIYGDDIGAFIGASVRLIMAIFASVTVGAFIARRGLLMPIMVFVIAVWSISLANTYAHREDYLTTLRVVDLDWPEAIMAILTTIVAVKTGEWIARRVRYDGEAET